MGRSVISTSDATAVAYRMLTPDDDFVAMCREEYGPDDAMPFEEYVWRCWDDISAEEWYSFKEWVAETAMAFWPSFEQVNEYRHNDEQAVLVANAHSEISISEYGGMIAISLSPRYDRDNFWRDPDLDHVAIVGAHWRKQIEHKFLATFSEYNKLGTASNGEAFFTKA